MSTNLENKLNAILNEKKGKILPNNIKKGVTIFNIEGTLEELDTTDATATAKDIAMNKTAYVDGEKITGTILEPEMSSMLTDDITDTGSRVDVKSVMPTDYLFRKNSSITYNLTYPNLANAIGLTPDKIADGNIIIGVAGTHKSLDTSDANATASDILKDKTAYVNGEKIVGTYEETGGESEYNVKLVPDSTLSTTFAARSFITDIGELDLQGMTSMNGAFSQFTRLKKIGKLKNTNKVTKWETAFGGCNQLRNLPETLDTSAATTIYGIFDECSKLEEVYLPNTDNVTNMGIAFRHCYKVKKITLGNTSNVTALNQTFWNCRELEELSEMNTSKVSNFISTFKACKKLKRIPINSAGTTTSLSETFYDCISLIEAPDIDFSNIAEGRSTFTNCTSMETVPAYKATKLRDIQGMFSRLHID